MIIAGAHARSRLFFGLNVSFAVLFMNLIAASRKTSVHALLSSSLAFLLYVCTLAPTVLWGDDAQLQRLAILKATGSGVRNYWLWVSITHEFTRLPLGDIAWRVNLACALFAALTVGVVFVILRLLDCSLVVAWMGSIALALSHTFWLHAVRTEVYSLFMLCVALIVALLVGWHKYPNRRVLLGSGLLLAGFAFFAHLLIVTLIPAIVLLVIGTKKQFPGWTYTLAIVAAMAGFLPYWLTRESVQAQVSLSGILAGFLAISGSDILLWAGFLGYQFILLTPLSILGLVHVWKTSRVLCLFLVLAFWGNVVFALSFHVPDQYVFYLPSYLIFVLAIGKGLAALQHRYSWRARRFLLVLLPIVCLPLAVYTLIPFILNQLQINLLSARTLPYRDNNRFFLYPPKQDYYGARLFGETVMNSLPPDAALLADWLPFQTLTYFQEVEGVRQDVLLADTYVAQGQLAWLLEQSETRPVFIADNERYYDIPTILREFDLQPFGPIYRLERYEQSTHDNEWPPGAMCGTSSREPAPAPQVGRMALDALMGKNCHMR